MTSFLADVAIFLGNVNSSTPLLYLAWAAPKYKKKGGIAALDIRANTLLMVFYVRIQIVFVAQFQRLHFCLELDGIPFTRHFYY